ncbi:MAG: hypothetical protein ACYDBB_17890 [Armatimonadota bacterium]
MGQESVFELRRPDWLGYTARFGIAWFIVVSLVCIAGLLAGFSRQWTILWVVLSLPLIVGVFYLFKWYSPEINAPDAPVGITGRLATGYFLGIAWLLGILSSLQAYFYQSDSIGENTYLFIIAGHMLGFIIVPAALIGLVSFRRWASGLVIGYCGLMLVLRIAYLTELYHQYLSYRTGNYGTTGQGIFADSFLPEDLPFQLFLMLLWIMVLAVCWRSSVRKAIP